MARNISGFLSQITVLASNTYPIPISITQFGDDVDPFDFPELTIGDTKMNVNGELLFWESANPIAFNLSVIADSDDDALLSILLEANRAAGGKTVAYDEITIVGYYPDGNIITLYNGFLIKGSPGTGVQSAGRFKTKTYSFVFQSKVGGI